MQIEHGSHQLPNIGFLLARVPDLVLSTLRADVDALRADLGAGTSFAHRLAGHIEHELLLDATRPAIADYVVSLAASYDRQFDYDRFLLADAGTWTMRLDRLWANFQRKHEFNPVHRHSGAYSFVIWLEIPYDLDAEHRVFPTVRGAPRTSAFELYYTNCVGQIMTHTIPVDRTMEGTICFFPAELRHAVHPFFTSDGFRVSVAGNIVSMRRPS